MVKDLNILNFNCVFLGRNSKYNFLDFWDEFIKNIFTENYSIGKKPKFIFKDISVKNIKNDEPVIIGRFVKDTLLDIEQEIDESNNLIKKDEHYKSAPSAIFILLLKNHLLLYVGEHRGYPSITAFKNVVNKMINKERKLFIKIIRQEIENQKKDFYELYPPATLTITPIPSTLKLMDSFKDVVKIRNIKLKQLNENGNFNPDSYINGQNDLLKKLSAKYVQTNIAGVNNIDETKSLVQDISTNHPEIYFDVSAFTDGKIEKHISTEGSKLQKKVKEINPSDKIEKSSEIIYNSYIESINKGDIPKIIQKNDESQIKKLKIEK